MVSSCFFWISMSAGETLQDDQIPWPSLSHPFPHPKIYSNFEGLPGSPVTLIPQASAPWEAPYGWGGPKACSWNRYCCGKGWWLEAPPKPLVIGMLGNGRNHKNTSIIINPLFSCAARNLTIFKGNKGASRGSSENSALKAGVFLQNHLFGSFWGGESALNRNSSSPRPTAG